MHTSVLVVRSRCSLFSMHIRLEVAAFDPSAVFHTLIGSHRYKETDLSKVFVTKLVMILMLHCHIGNHHPVKLSWRIGIMYPENCPPFYNENIVMKVSFKRFNHNVFDRPIRK